MLKTTIYAAGLSIGLELLLDEYYHIEVEGSIKFIISVVTLILFVVYARVEPLHIFRPVFHWIAEGMSNVNELSDWVLVPFAWLFKAVFKVIFLLVRPIVSFFLPSPTQTADVEADPDSGERTE